MYEILVQTSGNLIGMRISGKLTKDDYAQLGPWLRERIERYGKLRVLVEMHAFEGWDSLGALWEDLKLDVRFNREVERVAMVGEKRWQEWATRLSKPFVKGTIKYFDHGELEQAWAWLRQDAPMS